MEEVTERNPEKTRYFSSIALRNFRAARLLWAGEVLGKNRQSLDIWRNVSEHCLVQTAACDVLAEALGLPEENRKKLELAAMGHDWDKKYQSTGLRRINQQVESGQVSEQDGGRLKYEFFEESEAHSVQGMRSKGIPEEIIRIASADGHPALPRMKDANCPLEEKILHYVGSITDESRIVALDERVDNLEKNERYKMMNAYGRHISWTNGRTLYQVQREVGHHIERELVQRLIDSNNLSSEWQISLSDDPTKIPDFIRERLKRKYQS